MLEDVKNNKPQLKSDRLTDLLFLTFVVILSFSLYINQIGFYSDDWAFLGNFYSSADQTIFGLIDTATSDNTRMRPVQNIYDSVLYWLFGLNPFGYHLVNGTVMISAAILFYLVLRKLNLPRLISISVPLIYMLLPHYSADRFWFASFQANLSILMYFLSFWSGLNSISSSMNNKHFWQVISLAGLFISCLSYEVIMPLFLINLCIYGALTGLISKLKTHNKTHRISNLIFVLISFLAIFFTVLFKAETTVRLDTNSMPDLFHYPGYIVYIIKSALKVNYFSLGLKLPFVLWKIFTEYANLIVIGYGVAVGGIIFGYLYFIDVKNKLDLPGTHWMGFLSVFGLLVFILGYAIFFINNSITFSSTGIANRVAIAGAIGVAFVVVGLTGWISGLIRSRKIAKLFFRSMIAVFCASGFIIINTIAHFWIEASKLQEMILSDIKNHAPKIPQNSTLILDGICPYIGPGIVFESSWDLKGALHIKYQDPTLQADVVTPRLSVNEKGIYTKIYNQTKFYSFFSTEKLFIYNFKYKSLHSITNAQDAYLYFQNVNPDYKNSCPRGTEGHGTDIF